MTFEYELPDVGEGVAEGEILEWLVEPGDSVAEDEVLAEVETDKAVVDLPSPVDGVVLELHAQVGDMVPVGDVVVTLEEDGDDSGEVEDTKTGGDEADSGDGATGEPTEAAGGTADGPSVSGNGESAAAVAAGRIFAPPNVRRLARELGVDLTSLDGSGPSGRITEADVRSVAEGTAAGQGETADQAQSDPGGVAKDVDTGGRKQAIKRRDAGKSESDRPAGGAVTTADAADRDRTLAVPATRQLARELDVDIDAVPTEKTRDDEAFVEPEDVEAFAAAQDAPAAASSAAAPTGASGAGAATGTPAPGAEIAPGEREHTEAYRGVRRTIGKQMAQSAFTAPHATHFDSAEVSSLVEARSDLKARAEEQGVRLTYMPFVMKAIVAGLREHPVLNTELDEDAEEIIYKHYYNIGVAVATDAGLMVPVVKNVEQKSILELAAEINDLVERARKRKVTPEEMQGGTFTITNFGAIGGDFATPIINHPETAILGLGTIKQRPVVEDGEVVARHTLPLSLSIDHRVIDGADGARFCNRVIEYLENPTLLLLE